MFYTNSFCDWSIQTMPTTENAKSICQFSVISHSMAQLLFIQQQEKNLSPESLCFWAQTTIPSSASSSNCSPKCVSTIFSLHSRWISDINFRIVQIICSLKRATPSCLCAFPSSTLRVPNSDSWKTAKALCKIIPEARYHREDVFGLTSTF